MNRRSFLRNLLLLGAAPAVLNQSPHGKMLRRDEYNLAWKRARVEMMRNMTPYFTMVRGFPMNVTVTD